MDRFFLNSRSGIRARWICRGILFTCFGFCLMGCGEKEAESVNPESLHSAPEVLLATTGKNPPLQNETGSDISISFLPKQPTAEEDLLALLKGAAAVSWTWKRSGFNVEGTESDRLLRSSFRKGDEITVIVDAGKGVYEKSVIISNATPRIDAVSLRNTDLQNGAGFFARPEGVDADGDPISFKFTWYLNGIEIPELDSSSLPREMFREGDSISLKVIPFDGENSGEPFVGEEIVIPNAPPFFISTPPGINDYIYAYQIQAADPEEDEIIFFLEEGPAEMKVDSMTGRLIWKIPPGTSGEHRIRIVAEDKKGAKTAQEFILRI